MNVSLFINRRGLLWGDDPRRIRADCDGVLTIGTAEITVKAGEDCVLPTLFYGASGEFPARFKKFGDGSTETYDLGKVAVRNGRPVPPPATAVELMKLELRADEAERDRDDLKQKIKDLEGIFDTNSLNFLIYED